MPHLYEGAAMNGWRVVTMAEVGAACMLFVVSVVLLVGVAACTVPDETIERWEDPDYEVTCWVTATDMDCLPSEILVPRE